MTPSWTSLHKSTQNFCRTGKTIIPQAVIGSKHSQSQLLWNYSFLVPENMFNIPVRLINCVTTKTLQKMQHLKNTLALMSGCHQHEWFWVRIIISDIRKWPPTDKKLIIWSLLALSFIFFSSHVVVLFLLLLVKGVKLALEVGWHAVLISKG